MNVKLLLPASLLALAVIAQAEDSSPKSTVSTSASSRTEWNTSPDYWERVLVQKREGQELRLGKSGWAIKGPVIEGARRQRSTGERSTSQRLLGLPIVRLFVPQPTTLPPGGGKYLLWGESDRPWLAVAEAAASGSASGNPVTHEARTSLISIGR